MAVPHSEDPVRPRNRDGSDLDFPGRVEKTLLTLLGRCVRVAGNGSTAPLRLIGFHGGFDADRFMLAVSQIAGRRLTFAELTGKGVPRVNSQQSAVEPEGERAS
jgi:hypothetical protein